MPNITPHIDGRPKRLYTIKSRVAREWPYVVVDTADSPETALSRVCDQLRLGHDAIIINTETGELLYPLRRRT